MGVRHQPNAALRTVLAEVGWTGQELAAAVNAAGAEAGTALRYDRTSVSHWLCGMRPRPPVPDLVAEALSRRLGRLQTATDIGLGPADRAAILASHGGQGPRNGREGDLGLVAELARLSRLHPGTEARHQRTRPLCAYSLAALGVPAWTQAGIPASASQLPDPGRTDQAGALQASAAEAMAGMFYAGDDAFGGGHGRPALAAYLAVDLAPRLHARMSPGLRRRMLTITAQLTYLCAFMCFDDELHGMAQRYYTRALRLATENDDPAGYAITLRGMSVQAQLLGHHRHALQLAETAATTSRAMQPARQAFLYGQLAVAYAADHDRINALASLTAAQRRLDRASSPAHATIGGYHPAALAHQQAAMQAILGDRKGAITALAESIRHRPPAERRSRAITLARLAELQLRQGLLEEATLTWHRFLDDYPALNSGRATTALKTLRARVRPYSRNPVARALLHRATTLQHDRCAPTSVREL